MCAQVALDLFAKARQMRHTMDPLPGQRRNVLQCPAPGGSAVAANEEARCTLGPWH